MVCSIFIPESPAIHLKKLNQLRTKIPHRILDFSGLAAMASPIAFQSVNSKRDL